MDHSPFLKKLYTTYQPTSAERRQIQNIINDALKKKSSIDDELSLLNSISQRLQKQQADIDEFVNAHRTLISPIKRLPSELLLFIFMLCLPSRNSVMSAKEAPLLFGRICKEWRDVAYSSPSLWTSVHVNATEQLERNPKRDELYCDALRCWLERSGNLPLSVSLVNSKLTFPLSITEANEDHRLFESRLLDTLISFSHRWKHLAIFVDSKYFDSLSQLKCTDVPQLETVTFDTRYGNDSATDEPSAATVLSFVKSSSVRTVSLYNYEPPRSYALLPIWDNITKLSITSRDFAPRKMAIEHVEAILRQSTSLRETNFNIAPMTIQDTIQGLVPTLEEGSIWLPHLERLQFTFFSLPDNRPSLEANEVLSDFFERLNLPSLTHFQVTGTYIFYDDIPLHIPVIQDHSAQLESLAIEVEESFIDDLYDVLPFLIKIKRLHIEFAISEYWREPATLLEKGSIPEILASTSGGCVCPLLEDLCLNAPPNVKDEDVVQLLLTRSSNIPAGVARLKTLLIKFEHPRAVESSDDLQKFVEEGTDIVLCHYSDIEREKGVIKELERPLFDPYYATARADLPPDDWSFGIIAKEIEASETEKKAMQKL